MNTKFGYWSVGHEIFTNKILALEHASKTKKSISYHYYDEIYNQYDRSLLGKISLDTLYLIRAKQLREKYDFLILNYSGGCDSWNILHTFLKNNIKLDAVFIKWPVRANKIHKVNPYNTESSNFMSEWELAIKQDLEWLSKKFPEIKIEISDWTDKINPIYYNESRFENQNHFYSAVNLLRVQTFSDIETRLTDKGVNVGSIFGMDKPILARRGNQVGMGFRDLELCSVVENPFNQRGLEFFYWSPDLPDLAFEMAYQVFLYLNNFPNFRNLILAENESSPTTLGYEFFTRQVMKKILYKDYNLNRFQAEKPKKAKREDKDYWFYENLEFVETNLKYKIISSNLFDNIGSEFCLSDENNNKAGLKPIFSKFHKLGEFNVF